MALTNLFSFKKIPHISWEMSIHSKYTNFTTKFISVFSNFFSNAIICNSRHKKSCFKILFKKRKCHFISNGFSIAKFANNHEKGKVRDRYSIVVIARLSKAKNAINFINSVKLFFEETGWCPSIEWIGRVDAGFEYLKVEVDRILEQNKIIKNNWKWIGEVRDVRPYLSKNFLVVPSKWEGVPNVACEAMLSRCPVVATSISDLPIILAQIGV